MYYESISEMFAKRFYNSLRHLHIMHDWEETRAILKT